MAVITYKCPNCGGELVFDPETQKYKCGYCLSEFTDTEAEQANAKARDASRQTDTEEAAGESSAVVYTCPNCGAELLTDGTTAATFCFYCHSPVVLSGRVSGKYLPDRILPFAIDRKDAVDRFLRHVKRKIFIPGDFFSRSQIEKVTGVYFPYWLYGGSFDADYNARGTKVRVWRVGDVEYTETSIYEIERSGQVELEGLAHNALQKANRDLIESVQPYAMDELQPFSMGYLSGFQAEKRDMEQDAFAEEMKSQREQMIVGELRATAGDFTSVTGENADVRVKSEDWNYVMLPVWTVTYRGKDQKIYFYAMNGQSGKISGDFPVANGKLLLVSAICGIAVFLLTLLGGYFI